MNSSGEATYVARAGSRWWIGRGTDPPRRVTLSEVLGELDAPRQRPETERPDDAEAVQPAEAPIVHPVWLWVGEVAGPGIHIQDHRGADVLLEPIDLEVLDRLAGPMTIRDIVSELTEQMSVVSRRLRNLEYHGLVAIDHSHPTSTGERTMDDTEPVESRSTRRRDGPVFSFARTVRGVLSRKR